MNEMFNTERMVFESPGDAGGWIALGLFGALLLFALSWYQSRLDRREWALVGKVAAGGILFLSVTFAFINYVVPANRVVVYGDRLELWTGQVVPLTNLVGWNYWHERQGRLCATFWYRDGTYLQVPGVIWEYRHPTEGRLGNYLQRLFGAKEIEVPYEQMKEACRRKKP